MIVRFAAAALLALGAIAAHTPTHAQDYPGKPVKLIVPFAAGGGTDVTARMAAEIMGKKLGQPVVVENMAGASGILGFESVKAAAPDGYTIEMLGSTTAVAHHFQGKTFNPQQFAAIGNLTNAPLL